MRKIKEFDRVLLKDGREADVMEVSEWQQIQPGPIMYPGMTQMDFGYYQNPVKNKVDGSSCGVSIFESAKGRIRKAVS